MSTDIDTTRVVRSWLREDAHESADRLLNEVVAALDQTPQHRSRWPALRLGSMNVDMKLGLYAAAVLAVIALVINLLPGGGAPGVELTSAAVSLPEHLAAPLRDGDPPVLGRTVRGRLLLDLLAVDPVEDDAIADAVRRAAGAGRA